MSKIVSAALFGVAALGVGLSAAHAQNSPQEKVPPAELPPVVVRQKPRALPAEPAPAANKSAASQSGTDAGDRPQPRRKPPKSYPRSAAPTNASEAPAPDDALSPGSQPPGTPAEMPTRPLTTTTLSGRSLEVDLPATSNTADLLTRVPGVAVYQAGGVSGLPVVNGLADERVKVIVGGVEATAACANHMNPPLSYAAPGSIGSVEVSSGVTPVSKGGDSLGGTVIVEPKQAAFAAPGEALRAAGSLSSFYRSNADSFGGSVGAEAATTNFSLRYDGSWARSGDYHRGGDGPVVRSTDYEAWNHGVTLSARSGSDLFIMHAALQQIPFQGFPNQRMDMGGSGGGILGNDSKQLDVRYKGHVGPATVEATAFYKNVEHYMNFLADKGGSTPTTGMPMFTDGTDYGYGIKIELPVAAGGRLRFGNELHAQAYDEWWSPTCSGGMMCMMGPQAYWNINGGTRDRLGTFLEWEHKWTRAWTTLLGVRNDVVWMDTGKVQPYAWTGMMNAADAAAATAFNARDHGRTDINFDATAMVRYEPAVGTTLEAAYGRKTRSPNLYERYAWGLGNMAMNMVGWFGDVNGYTGDLDLKPEIANTLSFSAHWHDRMSDAWHVKITPYYTYVQDFIDVDTIGTVVNGTSRFAKLRFANHDAQLFGVNVAAHMALWKRHDAGAFALAGTIGYVQGERIDGGALYHMMPLHGRLALTHVLGGWSSAVEVQLVGDKDRVDQRRFEPSTPAYALLNLRTSYEWQNIRVDAAINNVFDKLYYDPLGGRDFADWKALGGTIGAVPAMGRSFNAGLTVKF